MLVATIYYFTSHNRISYNILRLEIEGFMTRQRLTSNLKRYRKARGLTQEKLARKVGFSLPYIGRLEIGQHDPPLSTLVKLATALKVEVADLLE